MFVKDAIKNFLAFMKRKANDVEKNVKIADVFVQRRIEESLDQGSSAFVGPIYLKFWMT